MGTISDKLAYLSVTKSHFVDGMTAIDYPITENTTFREMADMLYEEAVKKNLDVDLSDLPSYWHDQMKSAIAYTMVLGNGYVHHIVTTDNHYEINYGKSAAIQKILYDTGLYSKVINIGDLTNGNGSTMSSETLEHVMSDYGYFGDDLLLALGNHDDYHGSPSQLYPLIENNSSLKGEDITKFNYYCDDDINHIRYIVIDSPKGSYSTVITDALNSTPSGYGIIFISHYPLCSYTYEIGGVSKTSAQSTGDAGMFTLRVLGKPANTIICALVGHQHIDYYKDYLDIGILPQLALANDGYASEAVGYVKTQGTDDENVVSIVSINPATKDVKVYRIGQTTLLPKRFGFKYDPIIDMCFYKDIGYPVNGGISGVENWYTCLKLLPLYDNNSQLINYYIINKSQGSINYIYEAHYTQGGFIKRWPYGVLEKYSFTKYPICRIHHGNGIKDGATEMIVAITTSNISSASDLVLTNSDEEIDIGYTWDEIEWVDKIWRKNSDMIAEYDGYIGTKYVSVNPGQQYVFSVDDDGWSAVNLSIIGVERCGKAISQIFLRTNGSVRGDILFTIPDNVYYIQITCNNLANYTDKANLMLVE